MGPRYHLLCLQLCAVVVTITFAATIAHSQAGACGSGPCVATYHNDSMRDGVNSKESILSPSLFSAHGSANFGLLTPAAGGATGAVDGLIYAQPLYLSGVAMASTSACTGTQNIVLVATQNNSVYAFMWNYVLTSTGYTFKLTQCWMLNMNRPGEFAIPFTALPSSPDGPCNSTVPQVGITGTPVIDTSVSPPVMYVVTGHQTASLSYAYRLHAIKINSGAEVLNGTSAPYDLSGVFPGGLAVIQEQQRAGLAMFKPAAGRANLYVAFGSFCDTPPYSGYVAGLTYNYATQRFSQAAASNWVFDAEGGETSQDGAVWMSGAAPAVDSAGNAYVAVGNGDWNGTTQFGESVVKIATTNSGLVAADYYTPNDFAELNEDKVTITLCTGYGPDICPLANQLIVNAPNGDFDLGSGGVTLLSPAGVPSPVCGSNHELVAGGKEGVVYGVCYSTQTRSTLQNVMGGLDGCGYNCTTASNPSATACSESSPPVSGSIAQCFQGSNQGKNEVNGTNIGIRGTEVFWAGNSSHPENYLYVAGVNGQIVAFQMNTATGYFNPVGAPEQVPKTYPYPGTVPTLSWDGRYPNTALLWAIDAAGYGVWNQSSQSAVAATPAILVAYNAIPGPPNQPILKELWESSTGTNNAGPGAVKFTVPTVAGGLVFVPGGTPGYAPGPPGGTSVDCTAAALVTSVTPTICGGMLSVYGKLHS